MVYVVGRFSIDVTKRNTGNRSYFSSTRNRKRGRGSFVLTGNVENFVKISGGFKGEVKRVRRLVSRKFDRRAIVREIEGRITDNARSLVKAMLAGHNFDSKSRKHEIRFV